MMAPQVQAQSVERAPLQVPLLLPEHVQQVPGVHLVWAPAEGRALLLRVVALLLLLLLREGAPSRSAARPGGLHAGRRTRGCRRCGSRRSWCGAASRAPGRHLPPRPWPVGSSRCCPTATARRRPSSSQTRSCQRQCWTPAKIGGRWRCWPKIGISLL